VTTNVGFSERGNIATRFRRVLLRFCSAPRQLSAFINLFELTIMNRSFFVLCVLSLGLFALTTGCKSPTDSSAGNQPQPNSNPTPVTRAMQEDRLSETPATAAADQPAVAPAENQQEDAKPAQVMGPSLEPDFVTVQHILIAFKGSLPDKNISRSKEEAEALAKEILAKAQEPNADFDALVRKHTNDSHPGIYKMANHNVHPSKITGKVSPRGRMVAAFGDVGFPLQVGKVGMANYDLKTSPFGWHIIKRIE
jgi:hypothetical protein